MNDQTAIRQWRPMDQPYSTDQYWHHSRIEIMSTDGDVCVIETKDIHPAFNVAWKTWRPAA